MNDVTGNSRSVTSTQEGCHPDLERLVRKHLQHPFRKPYQSHTLQAFEQIRPWVEADQRPLIFDSCCGVGESTVNLAQRFPDAKILGMDKSADRLDRHPSTDSDNYRLLHVDLNDFWRLAVDAGWKLSHHFILYPNPWPKAKHIQRRWHGGALFPTILQLGGQLELRSNWRLYLEEFQLALELAGHESQLMSYHSETALTPFERKYWASGQDSWQLKAQL